MDTAITQWINGHTGQNDVLDAVMLAISSFGAPLMVAFVVALWWLGSPVRKVRYSCIAAIASLLLGFVLAHILLLLIPRIRPFDAGVTHLIVPLSPYRIFLSDHAIAATGIAFAFLLNRVVPIWTAILFVIVAWVCLARVYVGLHYASDMINDIGVGLVAAFIVRAVYRPHTRLNNWLISRFSVPS